MSKNHYNCPVCLIGWTGPDKEPVDECHAILYIWDYCPECGQKCVCAEAIERGVYIINPKEL